MAICHLFIYKNLNLKLQITNPIDKILSLSFELEPLKVNTYCVKNNQFCEGLSKGLI